jgi:hypothetical protein
MRLSERFRALLLIAVVAGVPAAAEGQANPDPLFKMAPQWRVQVEALMDSARVQGLPDSSLYSRAVKGVMMGKDERTIVNAVRDLLKHLRVARASMGPVSRSDLEAGVGALMAGVKPAELAEFKSVKGRTPAAALSILADLIDQRGVSPAEAIPTFTKLWRDGRADTEFQSLWRGIQEDISKGTNPGQAFQNRVRLIRSPLAEVPD